MHQTHTITTDIILQRIISRNLRYNDLKIEIARQNFLNDLKDIMGRVRAIFSGLFSRKHLEIEAAIISSARIKNFTHEEQQFIELFSQHLAPLMNENTKNKFQRLFESISVKILDGNIFLSGKVNQPEEKLKVIKMAWETKGVRSVKSAITIKGQSTFRNTAKDVLITSQLRTALIFNKLTKSTNYNIDTINGKVYIFGIAITSDEKKEVIKEAQDVYGVKEVIPSIILVEDLSRTKN